FVAGDGFDECLRYPYGAGRVLDVNHRTLVVRLDLHGRMRRRRGCAAYQQRQFELQPLHLACYVHHLVERRRDQAGQPDDLRVLAFRSLQNLLAGNHDAQIDHFEVVALQDHADDVLADVVNIAFHSRHDDTPVALSRTAFFLLDERHEMVDRFFHDPGRLDDLRQEHLAGTEEITDDIHAIHQWPFNDIQRPLGREPRFFRVIDDVLVNAVDQCVLESLGHRELAPGKVPFLRFVATPLPLVRLGDFQQPLGGVGAPGEDHVFDSIPEVCRQVLVDRELPRVDDPHVHACLDSVVQEDGMDRLANEIVTTEGERDVADTTAHHHVR